MAAPAPSDRVLNVFHVIEERINEDDWSDPALNERIVNMSNQVLNKSDLNDYEKSEVRGLIDDRKFHPIEKPLILHCKDGDVEISRGISNRFGFIRSCLENDKEATEINVDIISVQVVKDALEILQILEKRKPLNINEFVSNVSAINRKLNNFLIAQDYLNGHIDIEVLDMIGDYLLNKKNGLYLQNPEIFELWKNFLNNPGAQVPAATPNIKKIQELVWTTVNFLYEQYSADQRRIDLIQFLNGFKMIPAVYTSRFVTEDYNPSSDSPSFNAFLKFIDLLKKEGFSDYSADINFWQNWIETEPTVPREHLVRAEIAKQDFKAATFKILSDNCPRLTHLCFDQSRFRSVNFTSDTISRGFPQLTSLEFSLTDGITPEILDIIIEKCPKLKEIRINACKNITEEYIASLKERYPNLEIY